MLKRWNTSIYSIKYFLSTIEQLCPEILQAKQKRGRPPKRSLKEYVALIAVKEEKKASLRRAETDHSEEICGERVDHSVIHYWEKKLEEVYTALVRRIGKLLKKQFKPLFKIIDSTKFTTWKQKEVEFHTLTAITRHTVFPISVFFGSVSPSKAVDNVVVKGKGELMADRWYDDNKAMRIMFEQGYTPIIKPNSNRYRGYWRRKARKIYFKDQLRYRQRGRGESPYGSLTNAYGDRLTTTLLTTTKTRIAARIVNYLVNLFMRAEKILRIIRHALVFVLVFIPVVIFYLAPDFLVLVSYFPDLFS